MSTSNTGQARGKNTNDMQSYYMHGAALRPWMQQWEATKQKIRQNLPFHLIQLEVNIKSKQLKEKFKFNSS